VTVTKYRADILTDERLERVAEVAHEIADDFEAVIQNVDGGTDHVHILFTTKPTTDLTKFIKIQAGNPAVYGGEERDTGRINRRAMADRLPIPNVIYMNSG
jgi:REP element-mobilizing transposase RayT